MNYTEFTDLVFKNIPEFKKNYKEDLNENYYNFFLGHLGLFTRDSILNEESYSNKSLEFINRVFNENYLDNKFRNMLIINLLEILTDTYETQKKSLKTFTGYCLVEFENLLNDSFHDLVNR